MPALFGADREHEFFLRRLRDTTVIWRTLRDARRPSGAHKRGVRSEFLGLIIIIALNGYNGYFFRGIFNEMARAHRSRSNIHRRDYL